MNKKKKAIVTFSIMTVVLFVLAAVAFILTPVIQPMVEKKNPMDELKAVMNPGLDCFFKEKAFKSAMNMNGIIALCLVGGVAIIAIVWFICICANRRGKSLFAWLAINLGVALSLYVGIAFLLAGYKGDDKSYVVSIMSAKGMAQLWAKIFIWVTLVLVVLLSVIAVLTFIIDMVYVFKSPKPKKRLYASMSGDEDRLVLIRDAPSINGPSAEEIRSVLHDELSQYQNDAKQVSYKPEQPVIEVPTGNMNMGRSSAPVSNVSPIAGPLLVQYINTFSPKDKADNSVSYVNPYPCQNHDHTEGIPACIQLDQNGICKLLNKECSILKRQKEGAKVEEEKKAEGISVDEIRSLVNGEVKENVEVESPKSESKAMSEDDVRRVIREELAELLREQKVAVKEEKVESPKVEEKVVEAPVQKEAVAEVKSEVVAPVEEKVEEKVEEPAVEVATASVEEVKKEPEVTLGVASLEEVVGHEEIADDSVEEEKEGDAEALATGEIVGERKADAIESAPAAVAVATTGEEEKDKIVRLSFADRVSQADDNMKSQYNELKSELIAYGINSRISNSGDAFRLHRKTYAKITVAGKSLKIYFALDPADYKDSPIPISDAGDKNMYKDIPLVFKVRSDLSLRRAKQLIADAMAKDSIEKGKVEAKDWVKEINNESLADDE